MVYESFQMELGLDGNIFACPFSKYHRITTHSWFRVLWQYCSSYNVTIHMNPRFHLTATRLGDVSIIELFVRAGYSGEMLEILNRVRKFYNVHSLSDVLCVDGCTVDRSRVLSRQPGRSVYKPKNTMSQVALLALSVFLYCLTM